MTYSSQDTVPEAALGSSAVYVLSVCCQQCTVTHLPPEMFVI